MPPEPEASGGGAPRPALRAKRAGVRGPQPPGVSITAAAYDLIIGQYSVRHDGIRTAIMVPEGAWHHLEKSGFIRTEVMI